MAEKHVKKKEKLRRQIVSLNFLNHGVTCQVCFLPGL
jgi:hypothetical protein